MSAARSRQINFDPIHDILGVRLNKPYSLRVSMDIPIFNGSHADLLVIVSITLLIVSITYFCVTFLDNLSLSSNVTKAFNMTSGPANKQTIKF